MIALPPLRPLIRSWLRSTTALVGAVPVLALSASIAIASPQGGTVVQGTAKIIYKPGKVIIIEKSPTVTINWSSFNIAAGETVKFVQRNASMQALNQVLGPGASQILGSLIGRGVIILTNPNGIVIGPGATVRAGGFIASAPGIKPENFAKGILRFDGPTNPGAQVLNHGTISVSDGGLAALVAPSMRNSGIIQARLGKVALVAANGVTLDLYGDNLILFQASDKITKQVVGADGQAVSALVQNDGKIYADGGSVIMTANVAKGVVDSVINMTGIVLARAVEQQGGDIVLKGEDGGIVRVAGTLDASGKDAGQRGGSVQVLGEKVGLFDQAKVDVSGDTGGGKALIGGDYMGGNPDPATVARYGIQMETTPIRTAQFAYMSSDASIDASALSLGNGGKVVVWSDEATRSYGPITARGGALGGNGGFVETSGKQYLDIGVPVDAAAPKGKSGTWLLDPRNVEILDAPTFNGSFNSASPNVFTPSGDTSHVDRATVQNALSADTNVTITTGSTGSQSGNIVVTDTITKSAGSGATLRLEAQNDITVNAAIGTTGGWLVLYAVSNAGNIVFNSAPVVSAGYTVLDGYRNITFGSNTYTGGLYLWSRGNGSQSGTVSIDLPGADQISYTHNGTRATIPSGGIVLDNYNYTVETNFRDLSMGFQNNAVSKNTGSYHFTSGGAAFGATQAPDGTPEFKMNNFSVSYPTSRASDLYAFEAQPYGGGAVTTYPFSSTTTTTTTHQTDTLNAQLSKFKQTLGFDQAVADAIMKLVKDGQMQPGDAKWKSLYEHGEATPEEKYVYAKLQLEASTLKSEAPAVAQDTLCKDCTPGSLDPTYDKKGNFIGYKFVIGGRGGSGAQYVNAPTAGAAIDTVQFSIAGANINISSISNGGTVKATGGNQCVDLIKHYLQALNMTPNTKDGSFGNGKDVVQNIAGAKVNINGTDVSLSLQTVANGLAPSVGSVISFSPNAAEKPTAPGHVALVKGAISNSDGSVTVTLLENNMAFGGKEVVNRQIIFKKAGDGSWTATSPNGSTLNEPVNNWVNINL